MITPSPSFWIAHQWYDLRSSGGDLDAVIFRRDAAEWMVLALRMTHPVVGHLDPGQSGVTVEDDAEEVVGLALVPVWVGYTETATAHGDRRPGRPPRAGYAGCG